ncbi:hypothetical protein AGMMS49983_15260 [Clostridia bacterium]|nr:hypothetical protein AGMMS49983_15260 [Clostridia bacterium]
MSYKIGSLNIQRRYHLPKEEYKRDFFGFISDFIKREHVEILVLQEVLKEEELVRLLKRLPEFWVGGFGGTTGWDFAILWDSRTVSERSKQGTPALYEHFSNRIKRNPLLGRFIRKGIYAELRIVDVHLWQSDEEIRREECGLVTGELHDKIDVHRYANSEFRGTFTLVVGDYNYSMEDCNDITHQIGNPNVITIQEELTSLKKDSDGYSSSYDHFSFNQRKNNTVPYKVSRVDAVKDYFNGDYRKYKECVSDHVPVVLEIY